MRYSKGWKYRAEGGFAYKLQCQYKAIKPYACPHWAITEDGWLLIFDRYSWNGATKFPDFPWMMTQSCIHDCLHEAIIVGAISEEDNDTIDKELGLAISGNAATRWTKRQVMKFRAWYVRKATNTVDEKAGSVIHTIELPPLKHEITLQQFYRMSGR